MQKTTIHDAVRECFDPQNNKELVLQQSLEQMSMDNFKHAKVTLSKHKTGHNSPTPDTIPVAY